MGNWNYSQTTTEQGTRQTIALDSALPLSIGGKGLHKVQLIFVDDPVSSYDCLIQLVDGDFHRSSATARRVEWTVEGRQPVRVLASRPEAEPPRLSLRDPRHRWFELTKARLLSVSFRGSDYKRHKALFDVADLDRSRLDWDQQRYAEQYWQRHSSNSA